MYGLFFLFDFVSLKLRFSFSVFIMVDFKGKHELSSVFFSQMSAFIYIFA